jgi:acetyl-CoA C-acetyltransferase
MVCEPYPLAMNAMPHVDQAAAVLLTSLAFARELGVGDDRLVHVWSGAGCDDTADLLDRSGYGHSAALGDVLDRTLDAAGVAADALDLLDVYSCFPVVPKLAVRHLALSQAVVPTVTGGHSSFGGPLNSYSLHAVATTAQRLRDGLRDERSTTAPKFGLVHANGGYLTAQHAVLLAAGAAPEGYVGSPDPTRTAPTDVRSADVRDLLADRASCEVMVETATVEHGRDGRPAQAFVIGRTDDDVRTAVASAPGDTAVAAALSLAALPEGEISHIGRRVTISATDGGPVLTVSR